VLGPAATAAVTRAPDELPRIVLVGRAIEVEPCGLERPPVGFDAVVRQRVRLADRLVGLGVDHDVVLDRDDPRDDPPGRCVTAAAAEQSGEEPLVLRDGAEFDSGRPRALPPQEVS
jgi:hypothetical protein